MRLTREHTSETVDDPNSYLNFYNLSVSGFTTEDLLVQLPQELEVREREEMMVIVQIGMNDALHEGTDAGPRVSKQEFRENLKQIIELVRDFTDKIYFLEEPHVSISGELDYDQGLFLFEEEVAEYEEIKEELCSEKDIELIRLREKLGDEYLETLPDGVHPWGKGHEMIAEVVEKEVPLLDRE